MNQETSWRSRGYIPHFDRPNLIQLVTFRLNDAVPEALIEKWKQALKWANGISASDARQSVLRRKIEKYEDAGYGACWLRNEHIAEIVETAILYYDRKRYRVIAWCIMPNHVHVIIEILKGYFLSDILHSWKSYSSQMAN
jgi:putative transposase